MIADTILKFRVHDIRIHLHEIFYELLRTHDDTPEELTRRKELAEQFDRLDRMVSLYLDGVYEGWEDFDWKKAKELGWLSRNDEVTFKEFLT